jgi:NDP-sugar pyrophosphorylase family protein
MQAVILAGGKGTRLKPHTSVFPKPLVPVGDMPILEIIVRQLAYYGFTDIVLAVGHLKELIMAYFGDGSKWNVRITYSFEKEPLGTAGPIKIVPNLNEDFLVMNGDILCDLNFKELYEFHKKQSADVTITLFEKKVKIDLGVLITQDNSIVNYIEKPEYTYNVSMGIYIFRKKVLSFIPVQTRYDLPQLIMNLLSAKEKVVPFPFKGHWLDIGRPDDYDAAAEDFSKFRNEFLK